jgi:hypothetical protein
MLIIQNKSNIRLVVKVPVIFNLVANFPHFTKNILLQIPLFFLIKIHKKMPKFATNAYNMKRHPRFYIFIFWLLPNLAKYTYGLLPLEQHYKIEIKNTHTHTHLNTIF